MSHETVTKISALRSALIFEPPLTREQQYAIAVSGAYDLVPKDTELNIMHASAFYIGRVSPLTIAGRVAAALRASGFEAEVTNPGEPGRRELFQSYSEAAAYL